MPALNPEQLPVLAGALLRLQGLTLRVVAEATGIRTANLSVWLRGREQVISAARVTGLLHHLGIEGGRLRSDVLHQWADHGPLANLRTVFESIQANDPQPVWFFQDDQPGLIKVRFLQWGNAWIRLALTPDATGMENAVVITQANRVTTLPVALADIPLDTLNQASNALLELTEQMAIDVGDDELLDGLMHKLAEISASELALDTSCAPAWAQLERALRTALRAGVTPAELAQLISNHREGGNSACGRRPVSA